MQDVTKLGASTLFPPKNSVTESPVYFKEIFFVVLIGGKERKKIPRFSEFLRHRRKKERFNRKRDDFLPEQFELKKRPVPWKAIGYAVLLFVIGTALLIAGCLIHTGHVDNEVLLLFHYFKPG